ncbi:MAG: hypothetical protein ACFFCM_18965 [Promethearchaeota archaeon]
MIKLKIHCLFCNFKTEKKVSNKDSRGYFEVPNAWCNKCKTQMEVVVDGSNKNPDGEENGKSGN